MHMIDGLIIHLLILKNNCVIPAFRLKLLVAIERPHNCGKKSHFENTVDSGRSTNTAPLNSGLFSTCF